jgi:tetratricopeptide (TPR) repeat protein
MLESLDGNPEGSAVAEHLSWNIRAHADISEEKHEQALEKLWKGRLQGISWEKFAFSGFFSQMYERFGRAELLRAVGQNAEALQWYKTAGTFASFDVVYLAPSYLGRAEINEQLGNKEMAIECYRRFAELWKDCDQELRPILERARINLSRLEE